MTVVTTYALFGDDLRFILMPLQTDLYWYVCTIASMTLFGVEVSIQSYAKLDYACGFFFWLDFISTVSMIFDVGWVTDWMSSITSGGGGGDGINKPKTSSSKSFTRAIKIVRLIRLVRIIKLYKQAKLAQYKRDMVKNEKLRKQREQEKKIEIEELRAQKTAEMSKFQDKIKAADEKSTNRKKKETIKPKELEVKEVPLDSKISKTLSDKNTKTVVILILTTLFLLPFMETTFYVSEVKSL